MKKATRTKSCLNVAVFILTLMMLLVYSDNSLFAQEIESKTVIDTTLVKEKKKSKYRPKISGFIQFQTLWHFDSNNDGETLPWRFRVQRARLRAEGFIKKKISYQLEIDPRAPELSGLMRDAYISFHHLKNHEVKVGQQKTTFGYENNVSSSKLFFVNRTDVSDNLSRGVNLRDIGVGIEGHIPLCNNWRIEDAVTIVNGAGSNVQYDNTEKKNIWGRVGVRNKAKVLDWRVGASGAYGDLFEPIDTVAGTDAFTLDFTRMGADVQLEHKWFTMAAEYVMGIDKEPEEDSDVAGYYILLIGKTPWNIGPAIRYENMDDEFIRWTIGAYYGKPKSRFRVLVNYETREVKDDPEFPKGEDNRLYVWLQVRF